MLQIDRRHVLAGSSAMLGAVSLFPRHVAAQSAPAPPSAALFAAEGTRSVMIAPDGSALAWLEPVEGGSRVVILGLEPATNLTVPIPAAFRARSVQWISPQRLIVTMSQTRNPGWARGRTEMYEFRFYMMMSRDGREAKMLQPTPDSLDSPGVYVEHRGTGSGDTIIMGDWIFDVTRTQVNTSVSRVQTQATKNVMRPGLFEVNTLSGRSRQMMLGEGTTIDWLLTKSGEPKIRVDFDSEAGLFTVSALSGGTARTQLLRIDNVIVPPLNAAGLLDDNTAIFIDTREEVSKAVKMDLGTGAMSPLVDAETRSVSDVMQDPFTNAVIGLEFEGLEREVRYIDPQLASLQRSLGNSFRGKVVAIGSWSEDRTRVVFGVRSNNAPAQAFMFDTKTRQASPIGNARLGYDDFTFGERRKLTFAARDGLEITTWLTLPPGSNGRNLPLIVMPHGGPASQDDAGFDFFAHFLATRGYGVLQPQFRGSTGFGKAFEEKGVGEWGGKMQHDVSDAVAWAIREGIANPGKVAIAGASYGGYSALVGATLTPDLYQCAISINGVSDLAMMQGYAARRGGALEYWEAHMGLTRFNSAAVEAISPRFHAAKVRAPILLIHGAEDFTVPVTQSRTMARALEQAGKVHQLIELEDDDHQLRLASSREKVLVAMEAFLRAHIGA